MILTPELDQRTVDGTASAEWALWSTRAALVVTDPDALSAAVTLARAELDAVESACSRFRPDSELSRIHLRAVDGPVTVQVSLRLAQLVAQALEAARRTEGDVDPTVGPALIGLGYDRDMLLLGNDGRPVSRTRRADWREIKLSGTRLTLPRHAVLDLGATAKAAAADRCADLIHRQLGVGVLVNLGGDLATAGSAPGTGWAVQIQDRPEDPPAGVHLPAGAALATSSTRTRTWRRGGISMHHIVDPRTGLPAEPVWRSVSVAATSCVVANTLATAAIVRGRRAHEWLSALGAPARLLSTGGHVVTTADWPVDAAR